MLGHRNEETSMQHRLVADLLLRSLLGFCTAVAVAAALQGESFFLVEQSSPRVAATAFGAYGGCDAFIITTEVPLQEGQTFGWRVAVPDGQPVAWREELVLPEAPLHWTGAHFVDIRDHGKIAVTAGIDLPSDGIVEHAWSITHGDPAGAYELRLWLDGNLHKVFHFNVE